MSSPSDSLPGTPGVDDDHIPAANPTADMDDMSDNDSVLSDVDEAQFEDFDPANVAIDERPAIAVDEENIKVIGRFKRKRDGEVDGEKKKKKEGKREKPKKTRKPRDEDDNFSGGEELSGKRIRKKKAIAEGGERKERAKPRQATPENDDHLDPAERECSHPMQLGYSLNTG